MCICLKNIALLVWRRIMSTLEKFALNLWVTTLRSFVVPICCQDEADRQLQEQGEKHARARKRAAKLRLEIRSKAGSSETETVDEADINLARIREANRAILSDLRNLAAEKPDLAIAERLESVGINMPSSISASPQGSHASSRAHSPRPGSARSLRSSTGSLRNRTPSEATSGPAITTLQLGMP